MSVKLLLGIVAGALVALTVAVVVLTVTLTGQAEQRAYLDCLARAGYASDDPTLTGADLDGLAAAAERCS